MYWVSHSIARAGADTLARLGLFGSIPLDQHFFMFLIVWLQLPGYSLTSKLSDKFSHLFLPFVAKRHASWAETAENHDRNVLLAYQQASTQMNEDIAIFSRQCKKFTDDADTEGSEEIPQDILLLEDNSFVQRDETKRVDKKHSSIRNRKVGGSNKPENAKNPKTTRISKPASSTVTDSTIGTSKISGEVFIPSSSAKMLYSASLGLPKLFPSSDSFANALFRNEELLNPYCPTTAYSMVSQPSFPSQSISVSMARHALEQYTGMGDATEIIELAVRKLSITNATPFPPLPLRAGTYMALRSIAPSSLSYRRTIYFLRDLTPSPPGLPSDVSCVDPAAAHPAAAPVVMKTAASSPLASTWPSILGVAISPIQVFLWTALYHAKIRSLSRNTSHPHAHSSQRHKRNEVGQERGFTSQSSTSSFENHPSDSGEMEEDGNLSNSFLYGSYQQQRQDSSQKDIVDLKQSSFRPARDSHPTDILENTTDDLGESIQDVIQAYGKQTLLNNREQDIDESTYSRYHDDDFIDDSVVNDLMHDDSLSPETNDHGYAEHQRSDMRRPYVAASLFAEAEGENEGDITGIINDDHRTHREEYRNSATPNQYRSFRH